MHVSKVAPPHASSEKKPAWSSFSTMGTMSSVLILVAARDWWASLRIVSVIFTMPISSRVKLKASFNHNI
jgi:hypothetical protein